jgi:prepilin-type N-terminal cleavage/methylation domain-containing protein
MRIISRVKESSSKTGRRRRQASGFTLIETMIVLSIMLIASGMFFMSIQPALKDTRVTNAYNTTLMTLRRAREAAIAERRTYIVTFNNVATPNSITMTQAATGVVVTTQTLPPDVFFRAEPGIPVSAANTPDHFGAGGTALDFDQAVAGGDKTTVCFQPDGSATDINSNSNNGVVYMARTGSLYSSRAVTVWGATGRLRGYRLYPNGAGGSVWRQQ